MLSGMHGRWHAARLSPRAAKRNSRFRERPSGRMLPRSLVGRHGVSALLFVAFVFGSSFAPLSAGEPSDLWIRGTTSWTPERRPEFSLEPQLTRYEMLSWMAAPIPEGVISAVTSRCDLRPCAVAAAKGGLFELRLVQPGAWWIVGGMDHRLMYSLPVLGPPERRVAPVIGMDPGEPCWLSLEEPEVAWVLGVGSVRPGDTASWRRWSGPFRFNRFGRYPVWPQRSGGAIRIGAAGRASVRVACEPGEQVNLRLPLQPRPTVEVTLFRGHEALAGAVLVSQDGWPECLTDSDGRCRLPRGTYTVVTADDADVVIDIVGGGIHDVPARTAEIPLASVDVSLEGGAEGWVPEMLFVAHWSASGELLAQNLETSREDPLGRVYLRVRVNRHPGAAETSLSAYGYENEWVDWSTAVGRVDLKPVIRADPARWQGVWEQATLAVQTAVD